MKKLSLLFLVFCLLVTGGTAVIGESFAAAKGSSQAASEVADKVNINTADEADLATLPGVGEKTAAAIVSYRKENGKFESIDDLALVKGIGEKKLARLRPYLLEI